jgi:hypothetical protein
MDLNDLLLGAVKAGATDVHLQPLPPQLFAG